MGIPQAILDALADVDAKAAAHAQAVEAVKTAQQTAQAVADQALQHLVDSEAAFQSVFLETYPAK